MKQGSQLTYFSAADMSILQTGATMELERLFGYNFAAAWTGAGAAINLIISSPAASYSYAVGAGGAGGTATGSGSFNGGAGGQGLITIWAHYQ